MFTVIYSFKVKPDQAEIFEKAWRDMTLLLYKYEGSLGSRLHKQNELDYIAYAQWPDKATWKNAGGKLPKLADKVRMEMRASCQTIETLHELEIVDDLIEKVTYEQTK